MYSSMHLRCNWSILLITHIFLCTVPIHFEWFVHIYTSPNLKKLSPHFIEACYDPDKSLLFFGKVVSLSFDSKLVRATSTTNIDL